ncbi:MAG: hypothetical protein WBG86_02985 [Polyangiales bacterium]
MRWISFTAFACALGCLPGSGDDDLPGELVGEFEALGTMVEQSCGAAVPAPDPIELAFEVRLEESGRAYYRLFGGQTFAGTETQDEFTFQASQSTVVIQPNQFQGLVGCTITQRDIFRFTLEEPEDDTSLEVDEEADPPLTTLIGSQVTEMDPVAGSDCRAALAAFGGTFQALPCRIEYVLTGTEL